MRVTFTYFVLNCTYCFAKLVDAVISLTFVQAAQQLMLLFNMHDEESSLLWYDVDKAVLHFPSLKTLNIIILRVPYFVIAFVITPSKNTPAVPARKKKC